MGIMDDDVNNIKVLLVPEQLRGVFISCLIVMCVLIFHKV